MPPRRGRRREAAAITSCIVAIFVVALDLTRSSVLAVSDPCDRFDLRVCDEAAECFVDERRVAQCRCPPGYVDLSADSTVAPGRRCLRINFGVPALGDDDEEAACAVDDPLACDAHLHEVCLFRERGIYTCGCANGWSRLADGRCLLRNECADARLNDCHEEAVCTDTDTSYECKCPPNRVDVSPDPRRPGRKCHFAVAECEKPELYGVDCDSNAVCVETDASYECRCQPFFADVSATYNQLPGRRCVELVDECADRELNDCSSDADCIDDAEGYRCACRSSFIDASPNGLTGRVCNAPSSISRPPPSMPSMDRDLCDPNSERACRLNEQCVAPNTTTTTTAAHMCLCIDQAFRYRDGSCRLSNACERGNDCDPAAVCTNIFDTYECACKAGFLDASPEKSRPGRVCKELINECASNDLHDCSADATCVDLADGYSCTCNNELVDASSRFGLGPGRICRSAESMCATRSTCDPSADCLDTISGYSCQCIDGFVDVSASANLPPGRVCTIHTSCPQQKTDLLFLIDGSGSIGSQVFHDEVLRFVRDFVDYFDIGANKTRVALIQYSDILRHEFDLDQYTDKTDVQRAILATDYLTGLTRTGAALKHMAVEGFSERRGARPLYDGNVTRVAIVISDGRSQDNTTLPAIEARTLHRINIFSVGVSDHVLPAELEDIAGASNHLFLVDRFKDLDTRLRALIQKIACPGAGAALAVPSGADRRCEVGTQSGCARELNEICVEPTGGGSGAPRCECPRGFERHPLTHACGSPQCNPDVPTSCPSSSELCARSPFGTYRCICKSGYRRERHGGDCVPSSVPNFDTTCEHGFSLNPRTGACMLAGTCDPQDMEACDRRRNEACRLAIGGQKYTCRCANEETRHPITRVCLRNECERQEHDCAPAARCIDTDESFVCLCPAGWLDVSVEPKTRPGRVCVQPVDECASRSHTCSSNAECTDLPDGYTCRCRAGFDDHSPAGHLEPGRDCRRNQDVCSLPGATDCHEQATCKSTSGGNFLCTCKSGAVDIDELTNPGRNCIVGKINECSQPSLNRCGSRSRCIDEDEGYKCVCLPEYRDRSPAGSSGIVCVSSTHPCDDPTANNCAHEGGECLRLSSESYDCRCRDGWIDKSDTSAGGHMAGRKCVQPIRCTNTTLVTCDPSNAICQDTADGYECRCKSGTIDESPHQDSMPGRLCRVVPRCADVEMVARVCSQHATCTDTPLGIRCSCADGYEDHSTGESGRICTLTSVAPISNEVTTAMTEVAGVACGRQFCTTALNEVCSEGVRCTCRPTDARADPKQRCERARRLPFAFRLVADDDRPLRFSSAFASRANVPALLLAENLRREIDSAMNTTNFASRYITNDLTALGSPKAINSSWNEGLLVNFTIALSPSSANTTSDDDNDDERCKIWRALLTATYDGRLTVDGHLKLADDISTLVPECEPPTTWCAGVLCRLEMGEVCLDGSRCSIDYCSGGGDGEAVCPGNSTCRSGDREAICECAVGFVDIRAARRSSSLVDDSTAVDTRCLAADDVDRCALGLHNCSIVAKCEPSSRHVDGYTCSCGTGYVDGNPASPGRVCAALLCDLCNGHGDCLPDARTGNITCSCTENYTGERCELAPSSATITLLILLAALFLLLTLCCCIFALSRCRCFQRVAPWSQALLSSSFGNDTTTSSGGQGVESRAGTSIYGQLAIPRAIPRVSEGMGNLYAHFCQKSTIEVC